ncbi:putative transcriptional regulator [Candidatus Nitrososphaera evergladensis SR1]|jgi:DNA-binding PadR family transcriptional regulator|uniref:Putative transcriptional regulator n=1 Tax=Candidatus Nitrososphaera evergladensis SR1 TaxID=1459636 RepID=A0A075MTL5_9ARCH|nr:PadR family transcriptional regulator [Candidatus Nitrososphaera evergladensis]AIF84463.1 putative transcriptional regulator [Candidatus Nitrososphaera evergladensis SR1]
MISEWLARVGSSIPRGFSRHYILTLLKEKPMTGKEIIDKAIAQTEGRWKPSPGLIYPLLGRLLDDGLVSENEGGRYSITTKGLAIINDLETLNGIVHKQLDAMLRVGTIGAAVATDLVDRVITIGSAIGSHADTLSKEERTKYRQFLLSELEKLDKHESRSSDRVQKIDVE